MRGFLKTRGRAASAGAFWLSVVLVLPNCSFDPSGTGAPTNFPKGPTPHNDLIFCDIEQVSGRHCSTEEERARGIRLAEAAVALNEGRTMDIALDDSEDALLRCGGVPETVVFHGTFPRGFPVCVNCGGAIGTPATPDVNSACRKQCLDFFGTTDAEGNFTPDTTPDAAVVDFCNARARASINVPLDTCFLGACDNGAERPDFEDPRRLPEAVSWQDGVGVSTSPDGSLTKTSPSLSNFDAGAASEQRVPRGDAFVEFSATRTDQALGAGFTELDPGCAGTCADTDPSTADLGFAIILNIDGRIYVVVRGTIVTGPDVDGSFGTYAAGERFRVRLRDNGNGIATVSFARTMGSCTPGAPCPQSVFYTHAGVSARYPFRVDASLRDQSAVLSAVNIVRIR